jgi:hypothetical protein
VSKRALQREFGVGFRTVQLALESPFPQSRKPLPPWPSRLDPFKHSPASAWPATKACCTQESNLAHPMHRNANRGMADTPVCTPTHAGAW